MKHAVRLQFLLILFFADVPNLFATVGPVEPGQSLWCINKRIGQTVDIIESKLCVQDLSTSILGPVLCSKIDIITDVAQIAESKLCVASSDLDNLLACSATPIFAATIISNQGIYCVANPIAGQIAIQADDVELDLNNYTITGDIPIASGQSRITIKNGTVDNNNALGNAISASSGASNIFLHDVQVKQAQVGINFDQVTGGHIKRCTLTQNVTGLELDASHKITVDSCIAECNANAGFCLISSTTNCLRNCKALSTGQGNSNVLNQTIFGFVSANGHGNIFERCIANSTQALSTTDYDSVIAGFALRGTEGCSKIIDCEAANATANESGVTVPHGILLEAQSTGLEKVDSVNVGEAGMDDIVASNGWSPDGRYLLVGGRANGGTDNTLFIYELDYTTGLVSLIIEAKATGLSTDVVFEQAWSPDGQYFAIVNSLIPFREVDDFIIFRFDAINKKIVKVDGFHLTGGAISVYRISWSSDGRYIAVAGDIDGDDLRLFRFDPVQESATQIQLIDVGADFNVQRVAWSPNGQYLAVGGTFTGGDLQLYRFNRDTEKLVLVDTQDPGGAGSVFVRDVAWSPNGHYLAASGVFTGNDVRVYELNRDTSTLTQIISYNASGSLDVWQTRWSPDGKYLAIGGRFSGAIPNKFRMLQFDAGVPSLTEIAATDPDGPGSSFENIQTIAWTPDGQYLAAGGELAPGTAFDLFIYRVLSFPSKNVIKGNTVYCNSGGVCPQGVGISGSSIANLIIQNTSYSNPIGPVGGIAQNYQFVTNVFDQRFGIGPTALQNISVACDDPVCMPEDVALLMKQTCNKYENAQSSFELIESRIDAIMVDASGPCDPAAVTTSPTTLSGPGIYCIANANITGLITIDGSDVRLDLNNYTITGGIEITAGQDRITIENGVVSNSGSDAIKVNAGSSDITIKDVVAKNSMIGINFEQVAGGLIANCSLVQNTTGLELDASHKIVIEKSTAECNINAGFCLISSTTNCLRNCKALSTGQGNTQTADQTIFGFVSANGYGNIFENCIANSTQGLNVTDYDSLIAGFALRGTEGCSKIIACEAANCMASGVNVPYGILLEGRFDTPLTLTGSPPVPAPNDAPGSVDWTTDSKYIAIEYESTLAIYTFNRQTGILSRVASAQADALIQIIDWHPNNRLIAVGQMDDEPSLIYEFCPINNTLTRVATQPLEVERFRSLAWHPSGNFLAIGEGSSNVLYVYKFDAVANSLALLGSQSFATDLIRRLEWSPDGDYIAISLDASISEVYSFDPSSSSPFTFFSTLPSGATQSDANEDLRWSPDGKYLAEIKGGTPYSEVLYVYSFDETGVTLRDTEMGGVSCDWSSDSRYIVLAEINSPSFKVFEFNRDTQMLELVSGTQVDGDFRVTRWSPDGEFFAVSIGTTPFFGLYEALTFPSKNVIKDNVVYCNANNECGIGISGSSIANLIIGNTAYSNPTSLPEAGIGTNYAFVQNVFDQRYGQGPTALQNIGLTCSEPICMPEDLELLLKKICNKAESLGCNQTAITSNDISGGTISLTQAGSYCMASDLTSDLVISATCIALDMNNRILTGRVIVQEAQDTRLYNGRVQPPAPTTSGQASTAAITIADSALRTQIERVNIFCTDTSADAINGRLGIEIIGDDSLIDRCTIKSGAGGDTAAGAGAAGGTGILLTASAQRAIINACIIRTGDGGDGSTEGGNGGDGVVVSDGVDATKIIGCTIMQVGAPGAPLGASSPQGGDGIVIESNATKTMVSNCIIRNSTEGAGSPSEGGLGMDNRAVSANRSVIYENVVYNIGNAVKYSNFASGMLNEFGVELDQPPSNDPLNKVANVFFDPIA